jgi:C_GCAxxG_C_C family probable redox protein
LGTNLALQEAFGVQEESVFKAASGLHGGFGAKGDICGSLTGASLMLGLMLGPGVRESAKPKEPHQPGELDLPTRLVGELYTWFKKEFGSVKCRRLRRKHEQEVDAAPDAGSLTEAERLERLYARCGELGSKNAAKTAGMLWDALNEGK